MTIHFRPRGLISKIGGPKNHLTSGACCAVNTCCRFCLVELVSLAPISDKPTAISLAIQTTDFPSGWSSERLDTISCGDLVQIRENVSLPGGKPNIRSLLTFTGTSGAETSSLEAYFLSGICKTTEARHGSVVGYREACHAAILRAPGLDHRTDKRTRSDAHE